MPRFSFGFRSAVVFFAGQGIHCFVSLVVPFVRRQQFASTKYRAFPMCSFSPIGFLTCRQTACWPVLPHWVLVTGMLLGWTQAGIVVQSASCAPDERLVLSAAEKRIAKDTEFPCNDDFMANEVLGSILATESADAALSPKRQAIARTNPIEARVSASRITWTDASVSRASIYLFSDSILLLSDQSKAGL